MHAERFGAAMTPEIILRMPKSSHFRISLLTRSRMHMERIGAAMTPENAPGQD